MNCSKKSGPTIDNSRLYTVDVLLTACVRERVRVKKEEKERCRKVRMVGRGQLLVRFVEYGEQGSVGYRDVQAKVKTDGGREDG